MILENMKLIHDEKTMGILAAEENKLYSRMQRQLMEMTNFGDGTFFQRI